MLQYHQQFIKGFSHISKPIFATLKKGTPFLWTKDAEQALDELIKRITDDPQIAHPNPQQPFEMEIDASNYATGAVLFQRDKQGKRIEVGYHSELLNDVE